MQFAVAMPPAVPAVPVIAPAAAGAGMARPERPNREWYRSPLGTWTFTLRDQPAERVAFYAYNLPFGAQRFKPARTWEAAVTKATSWAADHAAPLAILQMRDGYFYITGMSTSNVRRSWLDLTGAAHGDRLVSSTTTTADTVGELLAIVHAQRGVQVLREARAPWQPAPKPAPTPKPTPAPPPARLA